MILNNCNSKSQRYLWSRKLQDRKLKNNTYQEYHETKLRRNKKAITLSSQLQLNNINVENTQKLSLVNKNIQVLDKVAIKQNNILERIKILYLSNNQIKSIQNIKQFTKLQTLSLSYNNIQKVSNIKYLQTLCKLTHLSLEGNPIEKYPIYLPAILNMNKAYNTLKTVDKTNINGEMKYEIVMQYVRYEQQMRQILLNYLKLVNLVQFSKKQAVHRIIRASAVYHAQEDKQLTHHQNSPADQYPTSIYKQTISQVSQSELYQLSAFNDSQQMPQLQKKIQFYLQRATIDIQNLAPKYRQNIEDSLNADIYRLYEQNMNIEGGEQQTFSKQCSPIQNEMINYYSNPHSKDALSLFMNSISYMQAKQNYKIQQLVQKIISKYTNSGTNQMYNSNGQMRASVLTYRKLSGFSTQQKQDIYSAAELIAKACNGKSKQSLLYEWKLIAKIFNKIKINAHKQNIMKYASTTVFRVLTMSQKQINKLFIINLTNFYKFKLINRMQTIIMQFNTKQIRNLFTVFFKQIMATENNKDCVQYERFDNQNQIVQKYRSIINNRKLLRKCWQMWKNYNNYSKLQTAHNQLKKQLQNSKMKGERLYQKIQLLSKLLQITQQKLKRKQNQQKTPKQIIKQIQNIQESRLKRCFPSPQQIRSNKSYKQNYNPNKPLMLQRKLNSSTHLLRIQIDK